MFFDIRKIKHLKNTIDTNIISTLYTKAISAIKEKATVGKVINGKYTTEYDKWCTANFVVYTDFVEQVNQVKSQVKDNIEQNYNVQCLDDEIHFLHYQNDSYYKSHIDGQFIENGVAKRGIDRDITAVLYLNDDYNGGEIFFDFFNISIKPKTGDILAYPTSFEYKHGVNKVVGERYAIVFWFKTNPELNVTTEIKDIQILNFLKD